MTQPFSPSFLIRRLADVERLEETPLQEALTVRSTFEIFCNAVAACGGNAVSSAL